MNFDIIGDIHGNADKLATLLQRLGYSHRSGAWRKAGHTAIFVGDFIDRGPGQLATIEIVRDMLDAGTALAVMGNHEFNAIAWHTADHENPGAHLRRHTEKNRHQHQAFLVEMEDNPILHGEVIQWFLTLPLWLDLPELRVVHACWHPGYIEDMEPRLKPGRLLDLMHVRAASRPGAMEHRAVEGLLKGLEIDLPLGHKFHDKDGHARRNVRVRWWDTNADTYRKAALLETEVAHEAMPDARVPQSALIGYDGVKPVFFGHYWFRGVPKPLAQNVACVDYSAAGGGPLVAYRWGGEPQLSAERFTST